MRKCPRLGCKWKYWCRNGENYHEISVSIVQVNDFLFLDVNTHVRTTLMGRTACTNVNVPTTVHAQLIRVSAIVWKDIKG